MWFARVLRDGVCLSVTERFAPFKEVGAYHVRAMLTAAGITDGVDTKAAAVMGAPSSAAARSALIALHQKIRDCLGLRNKPGLYSAGAFDEVEPFEDVQPGLERLREAGIQVSDYMFCCCSS